MAPKFIQFRPEPMDLQRFRTARQFLGPAVPGIEGLWDEEEFAHKGIWGLSHDTARCRLTVSEGKVQRQSSPSTRRSPRSYPQATSMPTAGDAVNNKIMSHPSRPDLRIYVNTNILFQIRMMRHTVLRRIWRLSR